MNNSYVLSLKKSQDNNVIFRRRKHVNLNHLSIFLYNNLVLELETIISSKE